jgi:hypothetical protein
LHDELSGLSQPSELAHWPVAENGFTINEIGFHRAEVAAIVRQTPMITQYEVISNRHNDGPIGTVVYVSEWHVVFVNGISIHIDLSSFDANAIPRYTDHAFDETLGRIAGIPEDHNVSALDRFEAVDEFINEDTLLIIEGRHHAGAFNFHWLVQKDDDKSRNGKGDYQVSQPDGYDQPRLMPDG